MAEADLSMPSLSKVTISSVVACLRKKGSLVGTVVDAIVQQRVQGHSWCDPLPPPRVSPPCTFSDALAGATGLEGRWKTFSPNGTTIGSSISSSSARRW